MSEIKVECPFCCHPVPINEDLCCACGELMPPWVYDELRARV